MQREFRRVNARHSAIRRGLVDPEGLRSYVEKLGEAGVEQILASGIAGVSPTKTGDLKCLHAHLADYLCTRRGGGEGKGWGRGGAMLRAKAHSRMLPSHTATFPLPYFLGVWNGSVILILLHPCGVMGTSSMTCVLDVLHPLSPSCYRRQRNRGGGVRAFTHQPSD